MSASPSPYEQLQAAALALLKDAGAPVSGRFHAVDRSAIDNLAKALDAGKKPKEPEPLHVTFYGTTEPRRLNLPCYTTVVVPGGGGLRVSVRAQLCHLDDADPWEGETVLNSMEIPRP